MPVYAFCGDAIESGVPLPELLAWPTGDVPRQVWSCAPLTAGEATRRWLEDAGDVRLHEWHDPAGGVWLTIDRRDDACVLRFALGVDFVVRRSEVRWRSADSLSAETVRHLLIDQVLPLMISHEGVFALHGSCVAVAGRAAAFVGASGQGKSTLAAAFAIRGCDLLSDDCVPIDLEGPLPTVRPAYPGLRLWPDSSEALARLAADDGDRGMGTVRMGPAVASYTGKRRAVASDVALGSQPLGRVYLLEWGDDGPLVRPADARAVVDLQRFIFRLDPARRALVARDFGRAGDLVDRGVVRRLVVPRAFARVPAVVAAVIEDAASW